MSVHPGRAAEYEQRHNPIWRELEETLLAHGVHSYSIFLDAETVGCKHVWEGSGNQTWQAVDLVPRDIILCDWHYEKRAQYGSVPWLAEKGFRVWPSGWQPS